MTTETSTTEFVTQAASEGSTAELAADEAYRRNPAAEGYERFALVDARTGGSCSVVKATWTTW